MEEQKTLIEEQGRMIETLSEAINNKNDELKCGISKVIKTQEDIVETYSEKAKKRKTEPVVVIKPKSITQKHEETRKEVKNSLDPTKIAVSCMKNSRDGGVIIECKTKLAAETLKTEAYNKIGEKYDISEPKKHLPKVKIVGITETNVPEEIKELICLQNEDVLKKQNSSIKVVHVAPSKKNKRSHIAYVEMDGQSYENILKSGRINIGWDRCSVYDAVDIPVCFKCCGFNHVAKNCKRSAVCAKCGEAHLTDNCEAADNECICTNCKYAADKLHLKNIDFHHHAWSKECPAYLKNLEIKKNKTDFL